ncbi:unnamed protein product [Dicrocoelium dendriticum]|nr:unnamed protein product [Dicrocoelium dendriticum]
MQPLSLCILRPKPEPTDSHLPIVSSNGNEIDASLDLPKKEPLYSEALPAVHSTFKTEQVGILDSLESRYNPATGEPLVSDVTEQEQPIHRCESCEKIFSSRSSLGAHVKCVHLIL